MRARFNNSERTRYFRSRGDSFSGHGRVGARQVDACEKFCRSEGMRLPGVYLPANGHRGLFRGPTQEDPSDHRTIVLKADPKTVRVVPWVGGTPAQCYSTILLRRRQPVTMAPRQCSAPGCSSCTSVARVEPVVAPELEFCPCGTQHRCRHPLSRRFGPLGRRKSAARLLSIAERSTSSTQLCSNTINT